MMAPEMKPGGREDATPRYGSGNVNKKTDIGTAVKSIKGNWDQQRLDIHLEEKVSTEIS